MIKTASDNKDTAPGISVIICAYNRAQSVSALLDCLLTQEEPAGCPFEVLVVDNNSTDDTQETVEEAMPLFEGRLRYLFEPRQGKSHALNLGIRESRGEVLAFIDDDCLIDKDYIVQVHRVFEANGDWIDFMGGRVLPLWSGGHCPAWLNEALSNESGEEGAREQFWRSVFFRGPLAILDYGDKPFRVDLTRERYRSLLFYGLNMAVKKSAFARTGGFAPDRPITQDTDMCLRLIRAGMKGLYAPYVEVYHRVPVQKLTPGYYFGWYFKRGRFLEADGGTPRRFYHPLGVQNEFIAKTAGLFLRSLTARTLRDKVLYRGRSLFNLGRMVRTMRQNII